jgi:hypothetical protein
MQALIDVREEALTADEAPKTELERMLIGVMARCGVQAEVCHAKLLIHTNQMRDTADDWWDADRRQAANNLGARLAKDSCRVAQRLESSLHGALWCLERWRGLGASAAANGGLTEPQRQLACDLLGISPLLRDNTERVPAAGDKEAIGALVAREVKRLEREIELTLKLRDKIARAKVRLGIVAPQDAESRTQRSNESRALKRLVWATDTLRDVQRGLAPATIIDPETRQPFHAPGAPAPGPAPPPGPAPAPTPAASAAASTSTSATAPAAPPPSAERPAPADGRPGRKSDRDSAAADALLNEIFDQEWRKIAAEVNAQCDPRYPRMSPEPPPRTTD